MVPPSAATKPAPSKRDVLVDTALELFHRHGYNATGIDTILAEAGVAKMTLYRHFASKDELIVAVARRREQQVTAFVAGWIERHAKTPEKRVLSFFDALGEWFSGRAFHGQPFRGCMLLNATAELPDVGGELRAFAAESKRRQRSWFRVQLQQAGFKSPKALAEELLVLSQGAIVTAQALGDPGAAKAARRAAEALLEAQARKTP